MRTILAALSLSVAVAATPASAQPRPEEITFVSHGVQLSGSIVLPRRHPIRAAVVFIDLGRPGVVRR